MKKADITRLILICSIFGISSYIFPEDTEYSQSIEYRLFAKSYTCMNKLDTLFNRFNFKSDLSPQAADKIRKELDELGAQCKKLAIEFCSSPDKNSVYGGESDCLETTNSKCESACNKNTDKEKYLEWRKTAAF